MLQAVRQLPVQRRQQVWLLIATRSASACAMSMLAAGASNDLFLALNGANEALVGSLRAVCGLTAPLLSAGGNFARTQRLLR